MSEKKKIKIGLTTFIIIITVCIALTITCVVLSVNVLKQSNKKAKIPNSLINEFVNESEKNEINNVSNNNSISNNTITGNNITDDSSILPTNQKKYTISNNVRIDTHKGKEYYIYKEQNCNEEYDIEYLKEIPEGENFSKENNTQKGVMNYAEYSLLCKEWNINQKYQDEKLDYVVFAHYFDPSTKLGVAHPEELGIEAKVQGIEYIDGECYLYINDESYLSSPEERYRIFVIIVPTSQKVDSVVERATINESEFAHIQLYSTPAVTVKKPIIYLYPKKDMDISVKLLKENAITCSYPKYNCIWEVFAKKNGDLIEKKSGRKLYSLYYESENEYEYTMHEDGFVVKCEDTIKFLEEKLAKLGLTEREAEEFIVYWLPKLESSKYNYIRFATREEIDKNMPVEINPKPDTFIRVIMTYKGIDEPIDVKEQVLDTQKRKGYVAVEWGGSLIK